MIILHISLFNGSAVLWGETAGNKPVEDAGPSVPVFPYDPGIKGLKHAVKLLDLNIKILKSNTQNLVAWIPSRGKNPLPSSPMIGEARDRRRKVAIAPFLITARELDFEELLKITDLVGAMKVHRGVSFGPSLFFAAQAVEIARNLAIKESFIPGVIPTGKAFEARWIPLPDEESGKIIEETALKMPGIARCLNNSGKEAPVSNPRTELNLFIASTLDSLIRDKNKNPQTFSNLHDTWINALTSGDSRIVWKDKDELRLFVKELERWQKPAEFAYKSPFRFCFRLNEPENDGDVTDNVSWQVEYLVQPKKDPSLLLPVSDLWNPRKAASRELRKFGGNQTEFMLTALGQAAGLSPDVAESLKSKEPGSFTLKTEGAFNFLQNEAPALRNAGFSVILPAFWVSGGMKKVAVKAKTKSTGMTTEAGISLDSLMDFDYEIALGNETLSMKELQSLAKLKQPLVRIRGEWTQIDRAHLDAVIRFLKNKKGGNATARELLASALGGEMKVGPVAIETVDTDGWFRNLLEGLSGQREFESLEHPEKFNGKLRPYQTRGFSWLSFLKSWKLGACLADDMGLGKTVQTLALLQKERETGENRPVLLICPTSVVNNWRKEAEKFTPDLKVMVHHGPDRLKKGKFVKAASNHSIVITSYGLVTRDLNFLKEMEFSGLILDEAQNVKNPETKQAKAVRSVNSDYRIALTGTPVENHVGELWALMDFLNPGLLGNRSSFKERFHLPIQRWRDENTVSKLKSLTTPFILRRLKTDKSIISDLPEKVETKEFCTLTKEQASLYRAAVNEMEAGIHQTDGIKRRGVVLAMLSKLKQICNHPLQFVKDNSSVENRSGKLRRLEEMLTEIMEMKERTLIFTQFAEMGEILQRHLQETFGEEVFFLHGGVTRKKRDEMVERFQNDENAPHIFVLSLKAGGTGLTLTRANHVIHYDRWWNPAVENQATDRAFRIGQKKNVQVHKFMVAGTLEERIDIMIESKKRLAESIVGEGEGWLTELDDEALKKLVELDSETAED